MPLGPLRRRRLDVHQGGARRRRPGWCSRRRAPDHASAPTSWTGVDAVRERARRRARASPTRSWSAPAPGGGLRLAVVGYERAVTAEAGHRVGLSAGAKVVHVAAGPMTRRRRRRRCGRRAPDLVLLVGGTDGGNADVLLHNAARLARARLAAPVVVAGNVDAREEVAALLASTGRRFVVTDNVLPRIGVVAPEAARGAIREAFLTTSSAARACRAGAGSPSWSARRPPTPCSGASRCSPTSPAATCSSSTSAARRPTSTRSSRRRARTRPSQREVVGTLWHARTVEADLGMRWNALGVVEAAGARTDRRRRRRRSPHAAAVAADPGPPAVSDADWAAEEDLRRHGGRRGGARGTARPGRPSERRPAARRRRARPRVGRRAPPRAGRPRRRACSRAVTGDHARRLAGPEAARRRVDDGIRALRRRAAGRRPPGGGRGAGGLARRRLTSKWGGRVSAPAPSVGPMSEDTALPSASTPSAIVAPDLAGRVARPAR